MKYPIFLVLLAICACSVPVGHTGWHLNVEPGQRPGELLTWNFVARPVDPEILSQVEELYARDLAENANRYAESDSEPWLRICPPGEKRLFQRADYIEYYRDSTRSEKVYAGCGPDSGEEEYWRTICVKEEESAQLVENHCFRFSAPYHKHCRFGNMVFVPSKGDFLCLEKEEIVADSRDYCEGEIGLLHVGDYFFGVCVKLQPLMLREAVHIVRYIER